MAICIGKVKNAHFWLFFFTFSKTLERHKIMKISTLVGNFFLDDETSPTSITVLPRLHNGQYYLILGHLFSK